MKQASKKTKKAWPYFQTAVLILAVLTHRLTAVLTPRGGHAGLAALVARVTLPALAAQTHRFDEAHDELVLGQGVGPGTGTLEDIRGVYKLVTFRTLKPLRDLPIIIKIISVY